MRPQLRQDTHPRKQHRLLRGWNQRRRRQDNRGGPLLVASDGVAVRVIAAAAAAAAAAATIGDDVGILVALSLASALFVVVLVVLGRRWAVR